MVLHEFSFSYVRIPVVASVLSQSQPGDDLDVHPRQSQHIQYNDELQVYTQTTFLHSALSLPSCFNNNSWGQWLRFNACQPVHKVKLTKI